MSRSANAKLAHGMLAFLAGWFSSLPPADSFSGVSTNAGLEQGPRERGKALHCSLALSLPLRAHRSSLKSRRIRSASNPPLFFKTVQIDCRTAVLFSSVLFSFLLAGLPASLATPTPFLKINFKISCRLP